jgi:hypothetical protein
MLGELGLQAALEAGLDQLLDQTIRALQLDLARVDLREQIIHHTRVDQTLRALGLSPATLLARQFVDSHQNDSFHKEPNHLHKQSDTLTTVGSFLAEAGAGGGGVAWIESTNTEWTKKRGAGQHE